MDHRIKVATHLMCQHFESIRDKNKADLGDQFWDLVVITASDEDQRVAFETQIQNKLAKHQIPHGLPYLVYADPPGAKIGCGGSTMHVLSKLKTTYGEAVKHWRILMLHAGGSSQRLPSATVLGKLFTPLPMGTDEMWQFFDLLLACFLPLLPRMRPGIFHSPSDTLPLYALEQADDWSLDRKGVTALAHPSSLDIGTRHGVYVLEDIPEAKIKDQSLGISCLRQCTVVLQKPTKQQMAEKNAIISHPSSKDPIVYSDSCFYMDFDVAEKLWDFYEQEGPLSCEICSYGDFMQAIGPKNTNEYIQDTKNVKDFTDSLLDTRMKVFNLLHDCQLQVLALDASKFYHFGSMREYLHNMCEDYFMSAALGFRRLMFSIVDTEPEQCYMKRSEPAEDDDLIKGCVMHSILTGGTRIPATSIVEYCKFTVPITVGKNCLLSNLECTLNQVQCIEIPAGTFIHTVPISIDEQVKYVTIFCSVYDDVKKAVDREMSCSFKCADTTVGEAAKALNLNYEDLFATGVTKANLWNMRIFPAMASASTSLISAVVALTCLHGKASVSTSYCDHQVMSMEDLVKYKCVNTMIHNRNTLYNEIKSQMS